MHWWKDEFCRLFLIVCCYFFSWGERVEHLGSLGYDGSKCIWMFVVGISLIVFLFKMCFWLLKPTSNIPEFHSSTSGYDHWNGSSLGWYFTMYLGQLSEPRCTEIAFVIIMKEEACTPNCPKTHEPHRDVVLGGHDLILILCVTSCCSNFKLTWGFKSSFWRNPNAHSHEILHSFFPKCKISKFTWKKHLDLYCSRCNNEKYVFISSTNPSPRCTWSYHCHRQTKTRKNTGFLQVEFEDGYWCYIKFRITENIRYLGRYRIV